MRSIATFLIAFVLIGCTARESSTEMSIDLGAGRTALVYLDEEFADGERVLVIDYKSENTVDEDTADKVAKAIWTAAEPEADSRGFANALIKFRFPKGEMSAKGGEVYQGGEVYRGLLFEAEKIENGTWKLKKVN